MAKRKTTRTTAQLITAAIKKSGKTQAEIAKSIGCGKSTVSAWCLGHQEPGAANLYYLAKALGIDDARKLLGK